MSSPLFFEKKYRFIGTPLKKHVLFLLLIVSVGFSMKNALALDVGDKVPACLLKKVDASNAEINLSQFKGQVLYVDFWASWCAPCAQSFPFMNKLDSNLKQAGLQIVAVNLDEKREDAQQFLNKTAANFTVASDADKQCAKDFNVQAMPSTYLIDRKGVVRYVHLGFRAGEVTELQRMTEKLLIEN
jgi:peroxiredoxin